MPSVVLMLGSESELAEPKEPGFYIKNDEGEKISISGQSDLFSTNEITITLLEARWNLNQITILLMHVSTIMY